MMYLTLKMTVNNSYLVHNTKPTILFSHHLRQIKKKRELLVICPC